MTNFRTSYISIALADAKKTNPNAIIVETDYIENGKTFTLAKRAIPQNAVISSSTDDVNLIYETSESYPYKVVTPQDDSGATIIYSPNIQTAVTASQNYYTRMKFERYQESILRSIDKAFLELEPAPTIPTGSEGE
jgi:hypothetical protein